MSGISPYDALAPHYREYSKTKAAYIAAVDKFIIDHAPTDVRSLLDVGSGDGFRGMRIARQLRAEYTVLCDSSAEMALRCREQNPDEVWELKAEDLPDSEKHFDVILCLWNTLGHLPGRAERIAALIKMRRLLSSRGRILLDVNNRHNAASYGRMKVLSRMILDALRFDEKRGDAVFDWEIAGKVYPGKGHLFIPREIESIFSDSHLHVVDRVSINYTTGAVSNSVHSGQLVYSLKPIT